MIESTRKLRVTILDPVGNIIRIHEFDVSTFVKCSVDLSEPGMIGGAIVGTVKVELLP